MTLKMKRWRTLSSRIMIMDGMMMPKMMLKTSMMILLGKLERALLR